MKHLFIPLVVALGVVGTVPAAYSGARLNDGVNPRSPVSVVKAIDVPKPVVEGVANGELDLSALGAADATVEVAYPDISDGHTVGLRWKSSINQKDYRQTVSGGVRKLIFKIPNNVVAAALGRAVKLTASVGIGDNPLVISAPEDFTVVNGAPGVELPGPTLPDVSENQVDVGAWVGDLKVNVHYPSINQGHSVQVLWEGITAYRTPAKVALDNSPLAFTIPHDTVMANLGKRVNLSYEVSFNGQPPERSEPTPVAVSLLTIPTTPVMPEASGGKLDLKALQGRSTKVTFTYPGITVGHTVGIRWAGTPPYDTPHPAIGATPRPLEFTIPYDKVRLEKGKAVSITASVGIGVGGLVTSQALSLDVIDTRSTGEQVADDLNRRYNDTREACDNNTPSYYCNGVTIRGTTNGGFDPWDPSPTSQTKGSVSFSYLKKGASVTLLARNSGYLLHSQKDAIDQGTAQEYLCSYPHDAWTDNIGRPGNGCGLQPAANQKLIDLLSSNPELANLLKDNDAVVERLRNNQPATSVLKNNPRLAQLLKETPTLGPLFNENRNNAEQWLKAPRLADLSTCASVDAATLENWITYTKAVTHPSRQCSLSTQSADQFNTSLQARATPLPKPMYSTYNELLIKVWPSGIPAQLPIQAFYYQNATGLPEARVYQQKYATRTQGLWLPVVKLDLANANATPFSYNAADQAVQP